MTDKEKAKELASLLVGEDQNQEPLIEILMEMVQWKEQQMMKDAIDGVVICDEKLTFGYRDILFKFPDNLQVGDKVKMIIVKED